MANETKFKVYNNREDLIACKEMDLHGIIDLIKAGDENLSILKMARAFGREDGAFEPLVNKLKNLSWSIGAANNKMSGYMHFCMDNLSPNELKDCKDFLIGHEFVAASFLSVDGTGLEFVVKCDVIGRENYKQVANAILDRLKCEFVISVTGINAMNTLSHDIDVELNLRAKSFLFVPGSTSELALAKSSAIPPVEVQDICQKKVQQTTSNYYDRIAPFSSEYDTSVIYHTQFPEEMFSGKDFLIFQTPVPVHKINSFFRVRSGKEKKVMFLQAGKLLMLNPNASRESLKDRLYKINKFQCDFPLNYYQISKLLDACDKGIQDGSVVIKPTMKRIAVNPKSKLTLKEIRGIAAKESSRLRKEQTIKSLRQAFDYLKAQKVVIRQRHFIDLMKRQLRTIKTNWGEIKKEVVEHNIQVKYLLSLKLI